MELVGKLIAAFFIFCATDVVRAGQGCYDLTTPQKSWESVIKALKSGDVREVKSVATLNGFSALAKLIGEQNPSERFPEIGKAWEKREIRWREQAPKNARALFGPKIKEQGLEFVRTKKGWKLDMWSPGE